MKKRTIREWFLWADTQGYEWAHKAMKNFIIQEKPDSQTSVLRNAVNYGFDWSSSPEGAEYWDKIWDSLGVVEGVE
jgi:hypothetical protein